LPRHGDEAGVLRGRVRGPRVRSSRDQEPVHEDHDPHPYVIGTESVTRFLTVAEECAIATRLTERPRV